MNFKMGEITAKGHALLSKVLAGAELKFTKVFCGDGTFDGDIWDLTSLINLKLEGNILEVVPEPKERRTKIVIRFTNETVKQFFMLREIGIYALDPDEGEILYSYANAGERANFIEEYNGQWYTEDEITFYVFTANATNVTGNIVKSSTAAEISYDNSKTKLNTTNLQQAFDEVTLLNPIECIIEHNLDTYPQVMVLEIEHGCSYGGCGDVPCGGGSSKEVRSLTVYDDRNRLQLRILKNLSGELEMERVSRNEFILRYPDTSLSVILFEGYLITPGIGETKLGGTLDLMSELAVRQLVSDEVARLTAAISVSKGGADKAVTELRTGLNGLSTTVTNNKAESGNSISKLNTALLSLNTTVVNNKMEADSSINGLSASLSELGTTVTSNKETVDKAMNSLATSLGKNIAAVPVGCGN